MLYDLNVGWTSSTRPEDLDSMLRQAAMLGYDVVGLNHAISKLPIPSPINNPIPLLPAPSSTSTATSTAPRTRLPTTLRRATVAMSDPRDNHRLDAVAAAFDILAVRPLTEASFNHACVSLTEPSIISLDLASPMGYHFRPKSVMAAVRRGVRFEVCYAQFVGASARDGANTRARALFVANLVALLRATKGRGIIVSSGAAAAGSPSLLRAPADVINLLSVWGLSPERGLDAMSGNPRGAVVNEGIKRSAFRGVVDIVQLAAPKPGAPVKGKPQRAQHAQQHQQQNQKGAAQKKGKGPAPQPPPGQVKQGQKAMQGLKDDQKVLSGGKRKNGEQAGADDSADEPPQKISRRQAKKQRRAAAMANSADTAP